MKLETLVLAAFIGCHAPTLKPDTGMKEPQDTDHGDTDTTYDTVDTGFKDTENIDTDIIDTAVPDTGDTWESLTYELCHQNFYLGTSLSACQQPITNDFLFVSGIVYDTQGAHTATVNYTQSLEFSNPNTGKFLFTQDDEDAPLANVYLFLDNSYNYVYKYELRFESPLMYDTNSDESAREDLVGLTLGIQRKTYTVADVTLSLGVITELTLESSDGNSIKLKQNNELQLNDIDIDGSFGTISSYRGALSGFNVSFAPDIDEAYLAEGERYVDPVFRNFEFLFQSTENDVYETLELVAGSTSAELRFTNNDGTYVEIPLAADASSQLGEASNEPIYWGYEAPTSATTNQDELMYLQGETCTGSTSVVDCQGAMFLAVDSSQNGHLMQITNVDSNDNLINIDDVTYSTSYEGLSYNDGISSSISTSAGTLELLVNEGARTITFSTTGGNTVRTLYGAQLDFVNSDTSSQIFEGVRFSEYNDGTLDTEKYVSGYLITAVFDDLTDNHIKLERDSVYVLGTQNGLGFYDLSDVDDESQKFMTWKGTLFTYDRENQQEVIIQHPNQTIFAVIVLEST